MPPRFGNDAMIRRITGIVFWTLTMLAASANATAACVSPGSSPGLFDELVTWSGSDDKTIVIKLEQGTYNITANIDQRGPGQNECCDSYGHNANIELRGGYKPGTSCDENQRNIDPKLTTLDGGGVNGSFFLW